MPNRRRILWAIACLLADGAAAADAELRVGASAALSGPAAALGRRYHAGARSCFEQVNKQGGIAGARIVVDLRDDAYEPDQAEANTRAFVEDGRILALFGYVGTPTSKVALPFVRRWRIPFLGPFTGADILWEPGNPQVFNVRASYREEAVALAQAMRRSGIRRLNVMYQADLFGRAGLEAMRAAAAPHGVALGAVATFKRNTEEVQEGVRALVQQAGADAIFMVGTYASLAAFVRQARRAGFKGPFYTLSFVGLEPLREALGPAMQGVTVAQVVPDPEDRGIPVVAAYQQAMREAGEKAFDSISLEGYLAARVLVEGLRRARAPLTRASLEHGLATLGDLDLGGFSVRYGASQRRGSSYLGLKTGP